MVGNREIRSASRLSVLGVLAGVAACSSVLGVEELHEGPRGVGAGNSGGTDSVSGSKNASGNAGAGVSASGGTNDGAGSGNSGSSNGGSSNSGSSNGGSATAGNTAGGDGGNTAMSGTVHGKVVDLWGAALPNVTIEVAGQLGATDEKGEFELADVPETYDASLVVQIQNPPDRYAWVYQGVTRRDPTFQVYRGRRTYQTNIVVQPTNVPAPLAAGDAITVAFGFPAGATEAKTVSPPAGRQVSPVWSGAQTTTGAAHALLWTINDATKAPAKYKAYQTQLISLEESVDASLQFDLTPGTLPSGTISGTVTPLGAADRRDLMFLRFDSHATITLMSSTPASDTFSYTVPTGIAKSSVTLVAAEGGYFSNEPTSLAHADGLAAGDSDVKLTLPAPATILQPDGLAAQSVTSDTVFKFQPGAKNDGPFVLLFLGGGSNDRVYVVTAQTELKLPTIAQGAYEFAANGTYRWAVQTHGDHPSVDDMLGPTGFLDFFADGWDYPLGPRQENGSFSESVQSTFITAP
jgi:hypothetical protein